MKKPLRRSGNFKATNDSIIDELLADPNYYVCKNGFVWSCIERTGKKSVRGFWRKSGRIMKEGYIKISYKGSRLMAHRIVYCKFCGPLSDDLVIDHKDENTQNNHPSNLQLVTQSENTFYQYRRISRISA